MLSSLPTVGTNQGAGNLPRNPDARDGHYMRQNLNHRVGSKIRSLRMRTRGSLRRLIFLPGCALLSWFFVAPLHAQPDGHTHALVSSNRFLFIVDTSSAMKRNLDAMLSVVGETISSSANGQIREGDSLGIWTYDQKLSVELPVQEWDPDLRPRIAYHAVAYLKGHRYGKTGDFDKVMTNILQVIKTSHNIMIFVISNGDIKMKGTPFDDEFNTRFRQSLKDMRGQKMPIVSILVGKDGKLDRYTLNPLPWPIVIPELPAPVKPPPEKAVLPQPPIPAPVIARKMGQPLILHGPDIPTSPAPTPAPAVAQVAPAPVPAPPTVTPATTEIAKTETSPATPQPTANTQAPAATPAPTPLTSASALPPAPKPVLPPDQAKSSEPVPAMPAVKPPAPPETASVAPTPDSLSNRAIAFIQPEVVPQRSNSLLAAVFALVMVALALVVVMVRRARATSGPSLITTSMRNQKN
jgi:hypothetical protein